MKISESVAWVGDSERVAVLKLDDESVPMILQGEAANLWLELAKNKIEISEDLHDIADRLTQLGLIEI